MASKAKATFKPPKWWECQWKRMPCGKDSCKLCGRINKRRRSYLARGEDPDDLESEFADVHDSFAETLELLRGKANELGIDLDNLEEVEEPERPDHKTNPVYNRSMEWYRGVLKMAANARESFQSWPKSEAGQDLLWYPSMIVVKTARQLDNRWELEHGGDHAALDAQYTGYVLRESIAILKQALEKLARLWTHQKVAFTLCLADLEGLEKDILKIWK